MTEVPEGQIGRVEAIDGEPLLPGRITGNAVACNNFQNAEAFLDNHGSRGPQTDYLKPGKWRINTFLFKVDLHPIVEIADDQNGEVTAQDGLPLPTDYVIAPVPLSAPNNDFPNARPLNHFTDAQAFIDSAGYRGTQKDVLNPGKYYINPDVFLVKTKPKLEIKPGFVGVIRSNVGKEKHLSAAEVTATTSGQSGAAPVQPAITSDVEKVLVSDLNERGIYREPLAPGVYNINTVAFTVYPVPTNAIMVDWADEPSSSGQRVSAPYSTQVPAKGGQGGQGTAYPYLTDPTAKGLSYFQFGQLNVVSKDVFNLEVSVRMIIRVAQENAAFVIARFGSIQDLISQIVHPLIDSEFRNSAGSEDALSFFNSRTSLQENALKRARDLFSKYHVEAQNLLISYINFADEKGQQLLATQNKKQIATQQQAQFEQEALAATKNIELQKQQATADKQKDLIGSLIQVDINKNQANAAIEQAKGTAESRAINGDGEMRYLSKVAEGNAAQIRQTGLATADAYTAQAHPLGPENIAMVKIIDEIATGKVVVTPQTLITSGEDSGGSLGGLLTLFLQKKVKDMDKSVAATPSAEQKPAGSG